MTHIRLRICPVCLVCVEKCAADLMSNLPSISSKDSIRGYLKLAEMHSFWYIIGNLVPDAHWCHICLQSWCLVRGKKWNFTIQTWLKSQGQFSNMACLISPQSWKVRVLVSERKCSLLVETRHLHKLTAKWIRTVTILFNRQICNTKASLQH